MSSAAADDDKHAKRKEHGEDAPGAKRARTGAREFLSSASVSDVLGEKEAREVVLLEHNATVGDALARLRDEKVLSAPVVLAASALEDGESGNYLGIVDCGTMLETLMRDPEFSHPDHKARALREAGEKFSKRLVLTVTGQADVHLLFRARADSTLTALLREGFLGGAKDGRRHVHRVALFDEHGAITALVTQSDAARFLLRHAAQLGGLADATVEELGLLKDAAPVVTVPATSTAAAAFQAMFESGHSAVGVVDKEGALVANISSSDLRGMTGADFALLNQDVCRFLKIEDTLEQVRHKGASAALPRDPRAITCEASSKLSDVLSLLTSNKVHRAFVTDEKHRPTAVVSLTDVMRAVVAWLDRAGAAAEPKDE